MNNRLSLVNQTTFRILYFKYKPYLIPIGVILASIFLFFVFIIPQFQDYVTLQDQKSQLAERVDILSKNFVFISSIDASVLDKNLKIATKALPQDKDFSEVLDAISNTSIAAGVRLGDYSFQVGDLNVGKDTNLQLSLTINGGVQDVARFISALKNQLPLADVQEVRVTGDTSTISLIFFYKPLPQIAFQPSNPIEQFSPSDKQLLKSLETMSLSSIAGSSAVGTPGASLQ